MSNSAEQRGNKLLICKCGWTVCVCLHFFWFFFLFFCCRGVWSVHLWESGWVVLYCLGTSLSTIHIKPSPSPSLLVFLSLSSLQQLFSSLGWQLEPSCFLFFFFFLPLSSRHKQELTDLLTYTNTLFLFVSAPVPHLSGCWPSTGLILDYTLRSKYSHSSTWLLWLCAHITVWELPACL